MNLNVVTYNVFGMPWGLQSIESVILWAFYTTNAEILCLQELFSASHKKRIEDFCNRPESQWTCWFPTVESTCLSRLFSSFSSISGLCVLTKKTIEVLEEPVFQPFYNVSSLDSCVRKGFFHLRCKKEGVSFDLLTTHFQSDFTECKFRISYESIRHLQEKQLYNYCKQFSTVIVTGDFNMNSFHHFSHVNPNLQATFTETGESLDHCLTTSPHIRCLSTHYYHEVHLSDHIPVLFTLRFTNA